MVYVYIFQVMFVYIKNKVIYYVFKWMMIYTNISWIPHLFVNVFVPSYICTQWEIVSFLQTQFALAYGPA
jgi:hypothetical protein